MTLILKTIVVLNFFFYLTGCNKSTQDIVPQAAPTITNFTPTKDTIGATITISGTNFSTTSSDNIVKINGISATITSASTTQLVVKVPSGLVTGGTITITKAGQTATSASNFRLLSSYEVFLIGNWIYKNSFRSDTVINGGIIAYTNNFQYPNLSPTSNYLIFTDSGKAYSAQEGWGYGMSGVYYIDTINYTLTANKIYLSYPAGINNYSGGVSYPAYQDTINISSLTKNSFSLSRYYHYKHINITTGLIDIKKSVDSLIK
jgi:IPT/TIG domain